MATSTETAFRAWDVAWSSEAGRAPYEVPEPEVVAAIADARLAGAATALDLGCGIGRHALAMARLGMDVIGFDAASTGLRRLRQAANGLPVHAVEGRMAQLPFPDRAFDLVVTWSVIYHGDGDAVRRAVSEIARVLRPGGRLVATMLSKRRSDYGLGSQVAPDTFVRSDLPGDMPGDKAHPHFFCDAAGLVAIFHAFELVSLRDVEGEPGSGQWHWHLVAERRPLAVGGR